MKKSMKRLLAMATSGAMILSGAIPGGMTALAADDTVAYLTFADSAWTTQYWYDGNEYEGVTATTAVVDGYGQYTVGLEFAAAAADITFFDVEIANGEAAYPDSFMTIDSVVINGEEVEVGATYTSSDNGTDTRTNLYNSWVSEVTEGRTADGEVGDATATPVDATAYTDITSIEVTFTLGDGVAFGGESEDGVVEAEPLPEEGTTAYLSFADSAWGDAQYWFDGNEYAVAATNATVTGYGQYTVSLDFSGTEAGAAADIAFFDVEIAGGERYFPNCFMTIDSVVVNGEEVEVGATYTSSDDGEATRTNLYNSWVSEVSEGRTADGEVGDATPTPVDATALTDIVTLEVTFTLGDGVAFGASDEEAEVPTEFTAFLMFSDGNNWENYDQGVGTECEVYGDGIYEVSLTAEQCGAAAQADPDETAVVFLVDITDLGTAMVAAGTLTEADDESLTVTDAVAKVAVYVDGERVASKSDNIVLGDIEGNGRLRIDLLNVYDGSGTDANPVVQAALLTPAEEIKVVFSLSGTGLNSDADTDLEAYLTEAGY
ncbi:MAG: hypothetical protein LUH53_07715 [Lachnospiraceae bacterium]|nr:hypothetical protein [Lachnospiraceae bacterium]